MAIEGGNFRCPSTGFSTPDPLEWNKHAEDCGIHTESGRTQCISCGAGIEYNHIPFKPLAPDGSKGIALQCENCMKVMMGEGTLKTIANEEAPTPTPSKKESKK